MALEVLSIIIAPVTEVGKFIFGAIRRQIRYVTKYEENVSTLEEIERELDAKKDGLQRLVDEARRGLKDISPEVVNWFETEAEIRGRLKDLHEKLDASKKSIRARRKLSLQLIKMVAKVRDLCEKEFSVIGLDQPHPAVLVNRTSSTKVNVPSRELIMEEVMKELEDGTVSSIGVHGMGGIGKTTLMNSVNSRLQESQLFKKVIMVTVSKEPDVKVVQDRIAERLGLQLGKKNTPFVRANKLFERLKAEESVLIILDDIWERLDTLAIGVPSRNDHPGCKVLLTTRDLNVCRQMRVQKTIKMEILSDDESWMIFEEKVGDAVNIPNLHMIGEKIVRRCNGSPLAIAVLGSTLRDEPDYVWSHALSVLQHPNATGLEGIMPEVVTSLRWSYDHLSNQNLQLCFLYCCMFAEDADISVFELRDYGIGDGFLSMTATVEEATNEMLYFVKILKDRGLLLDGDDWDYEDEMYFKMHDVVRDVAMLIASEDNYGFLVSAGRAQPESSSAYKRISIILNKEYLVSNPLEYPNLRTLIITFTIGYQPVYESQAEDDFFLGCPALRILSMCSHGYHHPLVPKSISQLTNLRTLYLPKCDLRNRVYLLGGLTQLQVLVMHGSRLGELMEEFGNLRNLRVLNLDDAWIDYIAPGIFSRLSKLEELRMWRSFQKWGSVGPEGKPNAGFVEVTTLVHLSILYIRAEVVEAKVMSNLHWLNKLKQFHVALNFSYYFIPKGNINALHITKANLDNHGNNTFFANSKRKIDLRLTECYGFKSFIRFEGFSQLSALEVKMCHSIKYLIDGCFSNNSFESLKDVYVKDCALLQNIFNIEGERGLAEGPESNIRGGSPGEGLLSGIHSICLSDLPEMTSIWKGVVPSGSLQGLTVLSVSNCRSLIHLLSSDMVRCLQNIEEIYVDDCSKMEKLIQFRCEEAEETVGLGKLRCIRITNCPNISTIFPSHLLFPKGRRKNLKVEIKGCGALPHVHNTEGGKGLAGGPESNSYGASPGEGLLSITHSISLSDLPTMTNIWKGVVPSGSLQVLTVLSVKKCSSLRYLLSSDMVRCLQNLEEIYVDDCDQMEKLILFTREEAEETVCLGKLRCIHITNCRNIIPSHLHLLGERHKTLEVVVVSGLKHIPTLECFFLLEEGLRSDNSSLQLNATTQFQKLLMIGWDDSIFEEVIKSGVLSRFVDFVFRDDFPQLQYEAVRLLANLVYENSDFIEAVVGHGVVPIFVNLLSSRSDDIKEQALWALGNIAGGSPDWRDLVLEHGILTPLLVQMSDHTKNSLLREAMSAVLKIFICGPQPPFEQMKKVLPPLVRLMDSNDEAVYTDACWVLFNFSHLVGDDIQILIEADVLPGLVRLLRHPYPSDLLLALWTIGDIIHKDSMQIQCVLDHQVLPYLSNVLTEFNYTENVQKATLAIISCITAGSENQIQAVITTNIISLLVQQSKTSEFDIKKEAVWAIANAICGGSCEQIKNLVSLGCITPICDLLVCPDTKLVVHCLRALDKILKIGKTEMPIGKDGVSNLYMELTGDCGGLEKIKNLRGHEITEIQEKAANILRIYGLQGGALPDDDKFAQADFKHGENELPVPSGQSNEASRPSFPVAVVKELEGGTEERK